MSAPTPLGFWTSLTRSQVSSAVATAVDFGLLFALTELAGVWYVPAVAIGAFAGAVTNFIINRHWSFARADGQWAPQVQRYVLVSAASLILNTLGTWVVTEWGHLPYGVSVVLVSLVIGLGFNFPLHRSYVFR